MEPRDLGVGRAERRVELGDVRRARVPARSTNPVEMRRGDSAYYDATMGHNVISVSEEDASILWVTSLA